MTLVLQNTFGVNLSNILELQAINAPVSGASSPSGIATRLFINNGVLEVYVAQSDTATYGGVRSELRLTANALNVNCWYTFDVRLNAADWVQVGTEEMSIWQIHVFDSISGTSINMSAIISDDLLKITIPFPEPPTAPISNNIKASYPWPFNQWVSVAMHANWQPDRDGLLEVFFNRVPIFRQYNRGTAYAADQPYLKLGIYDTHHTATFGSRRGYYRNLKIYEGIESYTTVLGGRPTGPIPLLS